jgi:hypothetical protein
MELPWFNKISINIGLTGSVGEICNIVKNEYKINTIYTWLYSMNVVRLTSVADTVNAKHISDGTVILRLS